MREGATWRLLLCLMFVPMLVSAQADPDGNEPTTTADQGNLETSTTGDEAAEATSEASNNNNEAAETSSESSNNNNEATEITSEASHSNNEAAETSSEASNNNNEAAEITSEASHSNNEAAEITSEASNNNIEASTSQNEVTSLSNSAIEGDNSVVETTTLTEGGETTQGGVANGGVGEGEGTEGGAGVGTEATGAGGNEGGGEEEENVTEENAGNNTATSGNGDTNNTNGNNTEVTDGNGLMTANNDTNTTTVTMSTTKVTTTLMPVTTTIGLQCGDNADAADGQCLCRTGWVRDSGDLSSTSCNCPDLCNGPDKMTCPSGSQCYHMTCNVASCRCPNHAFYHLPSKTCQDPCTYYGDAVCGLGSDRACTASDSTDVGYTCACAAGYTLLNDTCVDENECETTQPCGANEECQNVKGSSHCPCMAGYLRTESGSCLNVNECLNPRLHDCDHICEDSTPGYTCSCYEGYTRNETARRCQLNDESTSCECTEPTKSICYQPPDGDPVCNPKPGYQLLNETYTDQLECGQDEDQWCGVRGMCIEGTPGTGSICQCQEGYVNDTLNYGQCVGINCPPGTVLSGSNCVDPCSLVSCTPPMRCVVASSGLGECLCGILCQGLLQPQVSTSIYFGAIIVTTDSGGQDIASKVTQTLNAYFGKNSVEVLEVKLQNRKRSAEDFTNLLVEFVVMTDRPNMTDEVKDIIQGQCLTNATSPGTCVLPGGLVIKDNSITVKTKDPCESNPCASDLFQCIQRTDITGRFSCICHNGYVKVEVEGTPGYCKDIDECNGTDSHCGEKKECINTPGSFVCRKKPREFLSDDSLLNLAVAFGVLFVVTVLIAIGLAYLLMKKSHRVRELVPMTETSPGFENHAFHK